jgi:hypothetical protein
MDNTITALQALYAAFGGTAADVANMNTIPELINAIAALIATGDFGILPNVAAGDNGKVLTVSAGEWAAVTPTPELPTVTTSNNGDVLTVVEGAWAAKTPE